MKEIFYISNIEKLTDLPLRDKIYLKRVTEQFMFRSNNYYLSLINWEDPHDPIRRLIVPDIHELDEWGRIDPSNEQNYTIIPGLQHKYNSTALLLVSKVCGGICRYCFRKRIFLRKQADILRDFPAALDYIKSHKEITNILLTGGDPLMLSTSKLERFIRELFEIDHVKIIRIGTKMLSFNPFRVLNDDSLPAMIKKYVGRERKIYVVTHFSHSRELSDQATEAISMLLEAGAVLVNQTPLIKGVNDNPEALAELFRRLSFLGVPPYYVFQCRPAIGNKPYAVPIEEGYEIFEKAKAMVSGLAKRARYVMSHSTGKLEIVGRTENMTFFKYHRAAKDTDSGRFLVMPSNPDAYWLDDYASPVDDYSLLWMEKLYYREENFAY